ncbi:MAG: hypothetical protein ABIP75_03780 [Pyrinomonadaceae bacterium]
MLRCPKCSRTYETDAQKFCTHDGGRLVPVEETPVDFDPNATVHGNFAQFKEMGAMPKPPAVAPASPSDLPPPTSTPVAPSVPDLNKTVMGEPYVIQDPDAPTVADLVSASSDLSGSPEENDDFETQLSMRQEDIAPPPSAPVVPIPGPADEVWLDPPVNDTPQSFRDEQSFATIMAQPNIVTPDFTPTPPPSPDLLITAESVAPAGGPSANAYASAAQAAKLEALVHAAPPRKNRRLGLIFAAVTLVLILFLAAMGVGGYLYWASQQKDQNANQANTNPNSNQTVNTNNGNSTNANTPANTNTSPQTPPADLETFVNSRASLEGPLAEHYADFSFKYPQAWTLAPVTPNSANFADVALKTGSNPAAESFAVGWYESKGTVADDRAAFDRMIDEKGAKFALGIFDYQKVSSGETTINSRGGYEFRFQGKLKAVGSPDIWGRMVFLPPGAFGESNGVTLIMYATSLSSSVRSVDDLGVKGELPVILNSFKLGQ